MLSTYQPQITHFSPKPQPDRYLLGLVEEVMEVVDALELSDAVIYESCDCFIYLALLANSFGITLNFQTTSTIDPQDAMLKLFQLVQYYNHGVRKDELTILAHYLNQLGAVVCLDGIWDKLPFIIVRNETRLSRGHYGNNNS
jgi:NTP pyrophosphatase (non-canonical NTP hydrolase)